MLIGSCGEKQEEQIEKEQEEAAIPPPDYYFGIDRNHYNVKELKIKRGDTFGKILEENGIDYPEVYTILQAIKEKVDIRNLTLGKPYTLFFSKDSLPTPEYFVYHPGVASYKKIHLRDSYMVKKSSNRPDWLLWKPRESLKTPFMKPCSRTELMKH